MLCIFLIHTTEVFFVLSCGPYESLSDSRVVSAQIWGFVLGCVSMLARTVRGREGLRFLSTWLLVLRWDEL